MTKTADFNKTEETSVFAKLSKGAKKLQSHLKGMTTQTVVMRNIEIMHLLKIGSKNTLAKYWRELLDTGWITRKKITPSMGYAMHEIGLYVYTIQFVLEKETAQETEPASVNKEPIIETHETDVSISKEETPIERDDMDTGHVVDTSNTSILVEEKEDAYKQEHAKTVVFIKNKEREEEVSKTSFEQNSVPSNTLANVQLENVSMYSLNSNGEWEANNNLYANDLEDGQSPVFKVADFEGMKIKYFVNKWGRRTPVIDYYFDDDAKNERYLEFLNIKEQELEQPVEIINEPIKTQDAMVHEQAIPIEEAIYASVQLKLTEQNAREQKLFEDDVYQEEKKQPQPQPQQRLKIVFGYDQDNRLHNITQDKINEWQTKYNLVNVCEELGRIENWLSNNQFDRRSDICKFIVKWLKKSQDRACSNLSSQGNFGFYNQTVNTQVMPEYPQMNESGFQEVVKSAKELGKNFSIEDAKAFIGYYSATNWTRGNTRISNWKSLLLAWRVDTKAQGMTTIRRGMKVDAQGKIYDELGNDVNDYSWI